MPTHKNARYKHHRQKPPKRCEQKTYKTVPLSHTKDFPKKYKKTKGALAVVCREKKKYRPKTKKNKKIWITQSILTPIKFK